MAFEPFEEEARQQGFQYIAGVDEAGRGPLAGPVVAGACILPEGYVLPGLNDSKKLTPRKRDELFLLLTQDPEVIWSAGIVHHDVIDKINILQATMQAMREAIDGLSLRPDYLLVDGLHLEHTQPCLKIIKGDARCQAVAAGSIIAKVTRDRLMFEYAERWPDYAFERHKGYPTAAHYQALADHGPCPIHRLSFKGCSPSPSRSC